MGNTLAWNGLSAHSARPAMRPEYGVTHATPITTDAWQPLEEGEAVAIEDGATMSDAASHV
ncbi:MAG: hypothetical protein KGJ72_13465 [Gammaproteobacteria bacterium]|nr:hypothetical protein [Gammaproteobacteria bacterium]